MSCAAQEVRGTGFLEGLVCGVGLRGSRRGIRGDEHSVPGEPCMGPLMPHPNIPNRLHVFKDFGVEVLVL